MEDSLSDNQAQSYFVKGRTPRAGPRIEGFTLVEIMVAISVFAIISVASYASINGVLNARDVIEEKQARLLSLQRVHSLLKNDFRYAVKRAIRDEFGDLQNPMLIENGDNLLSLTTLYPDQNNQGKLSRVEWTLQDNILWRNEYLVLDRSVEAKKNARSVMENIEEVTIYHYVFEDDRVQRKTNWDDEDSLPLAIEIEVSLQDNQLYRWWFESSQL